MTKQERDFYKATSDELFTNTTNTKLFRHSADCIINDKHEGVLSQNVATKLKAAAQLIDDLTDLIEWMMAEPQRYTTKQHKHFFKQRRKLLTLGNGGGKDEN